MAAAPCRRFVIATAALTALILCCTEPAYAFQEPYIPAEERLYLPGCPVFEDGRLDLCADGDIVYVLSAKADLLYGLAPTGEVLTRAKLNLPEEVRNDGVSLWARDGQIFIMARQGGSLWRFDPGGDLFSRIKLRRRQGSDDVIPDFAVDQRGYIYAIFENSASVEVFEPDGAFSGTLAAVGERDRDLTGIPVCLYLDAEGWLYVSTKRLDGASEIVSFSYRGEPNARIICDPGIDIIGLAADGIGNVFALEGQAQTVTKFDRRGRSICRFTAGSSTALAVDGFGHVYLDTGQGGSLKLMIPSDFARLIDRGNEALLDHDLIGAERHIAQALAVDNQAGIAHLLLGEIYFQQRRWFAAMQEFKYTREQWRYSQALYGFRRDIIINYWPLLAAAFGFICLTCSCLFGLCRRIARAGRFPRLAILWAPHDALADLNRRLNPTKALLTVLLLAIVNYLGWYCTNPIFIGEEQVLSPQLFLRWLAVTIFLVYLWSWTAYKVGELFQGMAKNVTAMAAGTAACLMPVIVFRPVLALLSHFLTYQEFWIYQWAQRSLLVWVVALFAIQFKLAEEFETGRALGVGLIGLGTASIILCFLGFLFAINQQLGGFITELVSEVYNRLIT